MDVIGPIALKASPIDWKLIAAAHPTMPTNAVPKAYRRFFPIITLELSHLTPMGYPRPHQPSRRSQDITSDPGTISPRIVI